MNTNINYKYYYFKEMLFRVSDKEIEAMIDGKGWMSGWDRGEVINEKNLIKEDQARKIVKNLGELF